MEKVELTTEQAALILRILLQTEVGRAITAINDAILKVADKERAE
jgi:hypothetical protein